MGEGHSIFQASQVVAQQQEENEDSVEKEVRDFVAKWMVKSIGSICRWTEVKNSLRAHANFGSNVPTRAVLRDAFRKCGVIHTKTKINYENFEGFKGWSLISEFSSSEN